MSNLVPTEFLAKQVRDGLQLLARQEAPIPPPSAVSSLLVELESLMLVGESVRAMCRFLDSEVPKQTVVECELTDEDLDSIMKCGLACLSPEQLLRVALDRPTLIALHELLLNEWPDYWFSMKGEIVPSSNRDRSGQSDDSNEHHHLLALNGDSAQGNGGANPTTLTYTIPSDQVLWFSDRVTELTLSVWPDEKGVAVKVSPLFLAASDSATAILVGRAGTDIVLGEKLTAYWQFAFESTMPEGYFIMEYRSDKLDVLLLASLTAESVAESERHKLLAALIGTVSLSNPLRGAMLQRLLDEKNGE